MLTNILKSSRSFISKYKDQGPDALTDCHNQPEFQEILKNLNPFKKESLGIRSNNDSDYFKKGKISYFKISEDNDMSVGVFCLSKGT